MKWISAFGRFWYDFIVGDSVELAIGGCTVIALGALIVWLGFAVDRDRHAVAGRGDSGDQLATQPLIPASLPERVISRC